MSQDVIRGASGTLYPRPPVAAQPKAAERKTLLLTQLAAFGDLSDREQLISTTAAKQAYSAGWTGCQEQVREGLHQIAKMQAAQDARFLARMRERESKERERESNERARARELQEHLARALPQVPDAKSNTDLQDLISALAQLQPEAPVVHVHVDRDLLQKAEPATLEYDPAEVIVEEKNGKITARRAD